jgi:hypothetical protein
MRKARRAVVAVGIGAATSYFLDPQLGRQRRQDVLGRARTLVGAMRDERAAMQRSAHGDGDPTGGGLPSEPLPTDVLTSDVLAADEPPSDVLATDELTSDVLPTVPGPAAPDEPEDGSEDGRHLGVVRTV